uniref:lys-63-specific deubiquitinase BRCC36-like n=1 Tax=Myxine glutinosa TaxID=7769 RepID=UPI00358F4C1A
MVLDAVHINTDAFLVCLLHALSTENEEVMGLCIGKVDCEQVVHVMSVMILRRSDNVRTVWRSPLSSCLQPPRRQSICPCRAVGPCVSLDGTTLIHTSPCGPLTLEL